MRVKVSENFETEMFDGYTMGDDIGMLAAYLEQLYYEGVSKTTVYDETMKTDWSRLEILQYLRTKYPLEIYGTDDPWEKVTDEDRESARKAGRRTVAGRMRIDELALIDHLHRQRVDAEKALKRKIKIRRKKLRGIFPDNPEASLPPPQSDDGISV